MSDTNSVSYSVLSWEFDPGDDPWLSRVLGAAEQLMGLIRSVGDQVLPGTGIRWAVESLRMESPLRLAVRPVPTEDVPSAELSLVIGAISDGMRLLQMSSVRPPHFTDDALLQARSLVKETVQEATRMRFGDGDGTDLFEVTPELLAHIDEVLGSTLNEIGTVEGRLEGVNVHGASRYFNVYDALTNERIRCDFGHRISAEEIGHAVERRVAVHGEITYRVSGEIVRMSARSLEVFAHEDQLPTADDVLGIIGS